jgi:UDP-glucose 4-epimerase
MNILVTGANGLVGSNLLPLLMQNHTLYTISRSLKGTNNIPIDLSEDWNTINLPSNIDAIVHLAQSENFRKFPEKANDVFYTNTLSTLKLVDWAHKNNVKKFIYASSAGIYGNGDKEFDEDSNIVYNNALGFYLGTKYCSEIILDNYVNLLTVVQLRLFFVYGKDQRKDMLIPRLIDNVKQKRPITLQGQEGIKINPTHVSDAALAIAQSLLLSESNKINIAGPEVLSMRQIAETIGEIFECTPRFITEDKEAKHLIGNTAKMKKYLMTPQTHLEKGIKEFI